MFSFRRLLAGSLALLLVTTGCSSREDGGADAAGDASSAAPDTDASGDDAAPSRDADDGDAAAVLGEPDPASGEPLRIGFVNDGGAGLDQGPGEEVYSASVSYVNEYLGGVNGHPLEVEQCSTLNTPAGATDCGVQMLDAGVDALVIPVSAQDQALFLAIEDAGIPYVTYLSATAEIITSPNAFVLTNVLAGVAAPAALAADEGIDKVTSILIDVPAATAAVNQVGPAIYGAAGVEFDLLPISPTAADMTPQVQQAISGGAGVIAVGGTDEFNASVIEAIRQLGYDGIIHLGGLPSEIIVNRVPDQLEGIYIGTSATDNPADPDVQLFEAVMDTYAPDYEFKTDTLSAFGVVLGFQRALEGVDDAVDAPSILAALQAMPEPAALPLGGGLEFQCGTAPVPFAPGICLADTLSAVIGPDNTGTDYEVIQLGELMVLG